MSGRLPRRNTRFGKSRHAGMAGHRALHHADGQCRARAFAQPQAQRQQRLLAQLFQQPAMRALGATVPILPGVLPVQSLESLKRILFLSGCNIPAKLFLTLEEAHAKGGAEAVREAGIAFAVEQTRRLLDCGAPGVHLYTLNKADVCLRIASEIGPL